MKNRVLFIGMCASLAAFVFHEASATQNLLVKGGLSLQSSMDVAANKKKGGVAVNANVNRLPGRSPAGNMNKILTQSKAPQDDKAAQGASTTDSEKDIYQWFQTYSEVISLIEKKSFREVDFARFIQDSLKAAVAQIDAHSAFFTRESYKAAMESTSGEFSGIGVSIISKTPEDEALVIVDVIQEGPAEKSGLKGGDKIIEVNGEKLRGLSSDEVVNKLKGKVGSTVRVKIMRAKKPLKFKVVRDTIKDQTSLCYRFKDQNIYYLSLKIFNEVAAQQVEEILTKANDGKCTGIIIDLRRNPGGTMDSAIDMAGLFLKKDSLVVSTKNRSRQRVAEYRTNRDPLLKSDTPIFILIDNFTASAAEILAGALQYHATKNAAADSKDGKNNGSDKNLMVFLLGTQSFGKGSVQELIPVKNGCALKVTIMLYYLPNDESVQARGITPDFTVKPKLFPADEMKWINELYGKETALKNHITVDEVTGKKQKSEKNKKGFWGRLFGSSDEEEAHSSESSAQQESDEDDGDDTEGTAKSSKRKKKNWEEEQREGLALDIQVQASVNMINLLALAKRGMPDAVNTRDKALSFLKKQYLTDDPTQVEKVK